MSEPILKFKIGNKSFNNPVFTASGTFGYGLEFAEVFPLDSVGAICTKGLSILPRKGNPPPRIYETPSGMLNSIGIENVGVEAFVKEKLPALRKYKATIVANVYGTTVKEYIQVVERLEKSRGIHAYEINLSCPNVKEGGMEFGHNKRRVKEVISKVRETTKKPIIAKLSPNTTIIADQAKACEDAGADALTAINTLLGMSIDIRKRRPHISTVTGGLSGPAIRPIAIAKVWKCAQAVKIPIIGSGGIMTWEDAIEFFMAGASAVQVGTANFVHPDSAIRILEGITAYAREQGVKRLTDLRLDL